MKRLLILRHAKAGAAQAGIADHDRPLEGLGRRQAVEVGRLLREEALVPDTVVTSSALRALDTWHLVAEACGYDRPLFATDRLYSEDIDDWLSVIAERAAGASTVMVVGHNPGLEALVETLTRRAEALSPAALACIALPIEAWSDLDAGVRGSLVGLWRAGSGTHG